MRKKNLALLDRVMRVKEPPPAPTAQPGNRHERREKEAKDRALRRQLLKDPRVLSIAPNEGDFRVEYKTDVPECTCAMRAAMMAMDSNIFPQPCPVHAAVHPNR